MCRATAPLYQRLSLSKIYCSQLQKFSSSTILDISAPKDKQRAELFFTIDRPGSLFLICKCNRTKKQKSSNYSNLYSHITIEHATELNKLSKNQIYKGSTTHFLLHKNVRKAYAWT